MTLELYDMLLHLTKRLERAGVKAIGSFSYDETCVVVDIWQADGDIGHVCLPMPFAVMPSVIARRMEALR
jgi:hypothetical protein